MEENDEKTAKKEIKYRASEKGLKGGAGEDRKLVRRALTNFAKELDIDDLDKLKKKNKKKKTK